MPLNKETKPNLFWFLSLSLFSKPRLAVPDAPTAIVAQSTGATEYTNCISADGVRLPQRVSWLWH